MNHYRQLCICLLLQTTLLVADRLAADLILDVNFKRSIAVTSRAFLSLTVDPATLPSNADAIAEDVERSTNLARGLVPAYIRLGGPRSNSRAFERTYVDTDLGDVFFGTSWALVHRWASAAGLDVIACISPGYIENESGIRSGDPMGNVAQLLTFSDRVGYNVSWQLGYECQTRCDLSGGDLGRYVANLREMLKTFPRYSNSLITGPDVIAYRNAKQQEYLQDYFDSAGAALSAITWHPDFATATVNNGSIAVHYDDMATEKDELYKVIDRMTRKKPLWIAESRSEEGKHQYLGALIWTRRLGNAAKLGIQVVMRQMSDFNKATPDYWVSLLHKTLVGREVLEVNVQSSNGSRVHFYGQCTRSSALYDKGAVTIFGANLSPRDVTANLKGLGTKTLHKYILSPDSQAGNEMFSEKVLLNNKQLDLVNGKTLPDLNPEIVTDLDDIELRLSSGGIGFWVIPDAKVNACTHSEGKTTGSATAKRLSKRHENVIRRDKQGEERKEEEEKGIRQLNTENRKILARHERRSQKSLEKESGENQQKFWTPQLLLRLKRILQKQLRRKEKNDPSYLQKLSTSVSVGERGNSSEEAREQKNLDNKYFEKVEETDDKVVSSYNIRDTMRKYKRTPMGKQTRVEAEHPKSETSNIDDTLALLSKVEALLQLHEKNVASNSIKGTTKKEGKLVTEANSRLKEELNKLKDYAKSTDNFNVLYNLLKYSERIKKDKDNDIPARENSTNEKRSRRDLSETLGNLKSHIDGKLSTLDDLKNKINERAKSRNDDRTLLGSKLGHHNNNRSDRCGSHRRGLLKRLLKGDSSSQRSVREHRRTNRDTDRKLTESLRMDSIFRKHSRIDDVRDYVNERKTKLKNDPRKDVVLSPFNSKTESDENDFYGFLRQDHIEGFPEGDVFLTTGNSEERNGQDYDYIEDDEDDSNKKNAQQEQESMSNHAEDTTWIEQDGDHRDYVPNEFFENVKLSNTKIGKDTTNYGDLYEAEFLLGNTEGDKGDDNNNNGMIVTDAAWEHHQAPNVKHDEAKLNGRKVSDANEPNGKNNVNMKTTRAYESIGLHADGFIKPHGRGAKRSDREKLRMTPAEEMIKENEGNTGDYHHRVIRASNLSKELRNYRVEGNGQTTVESVDSSTDNERANAKLDTDFARSDIQKSTTKEEYERIMAGEILPSSSLIETDVDHNEAEVTAEIATAESRGSNLKPRDVNQTIEVLLTSPTPDNETSDTTKRHSGSDESIVEELLVDLSSGPSVDNSNAIQQVTERTFFRTQSPDTTAEPEKTTYDFVETDPKIFPRSGDSREGLAVSSSAQQATSFLYEKKKALKKKKETEQELIGAVTDGRTNAEQKLGGNNEVEWKPNYSHEGMTEKIAEERMMAETALSKRAANNSSDSLKPRETKTRRKIQRNSEDDSRGRSKSADRTRGKEDSDLKRAKVMLKDFPKMPLRGLARHEEYLVRRAEQIEKLQEKLNAKRENLMRQYEQDLSKVANEQDNGKRSLKRREAWERLWERDYLRRPTDQGRLIGIVISDDTTREDDSGDDERYGEAYLAIEFAHERFDDVTQDRAYSRANVKHARYPEHKPRYQISRLSKVLKECERESTEASDPSDRKIFAIDPSTYHGDEPILQTHEDRLEDRSRLTFGDLYRIFSKAEQVYGGRHKSESYEDYYHPEYTKEAPTDDLYKQESSIALYVLDKHRLRNASNEPRKFSPSLLKLLEQPDINQITEDKTARELNNNTTDSTAGATEDSMKVTSQGDFATGSCTRNARDEREGVSNVEVAADTKDAEDITGPKNFNTNEEVISDGTRSKDAKLSTEPEDPDNKEGNIAYDEITENATVINKKIHSSSDDVAETTNNNTEIRDFGKVNDDDATASTLGKMDIRTRRNAERVSPDRTDTKNEIKRGGYICTKEDSKEIFNENQLIPFLRLTRLPLDSTQFRKPKNNVASSYKSSGVDQRNEEKYKPPRYMILVSTEADDARSYETLKMRNPENSLEHFKISSWLDQYLPRKITDSMAQYSNDLSSDEYKDILSTTDKSAENTSNEEVSYSSDRSNESMKKRQGISKDLENGRFDHESRKEDERYGIKNEAFDMYSRIKDQMRPDEWQVFMLLPWVNEKITRQRRQIGNEIDKSRAYEYITVDDEEHGYSLNKNNGNKKEITREIYPQIQNGNEVRNDLLKDFIEARKNDAVSQKTEKDDENLTNDILEDDKKFPWFMEEMLENVIDNMEETQNFTEPAGQSVDYSEKKFNGTLAMDEDEMSKNKTSGNTNSAFHVAIKNIKKFFTLFSGLSRILSV